MAGSDGMLLLGLDFGQRGRGRVAQQRTLARAAVRAEHVWPAGSFALVRASGERVPLRAVDAGQNGTLRVWRLYVDGPEKVPAAGELVTPPRPPYTAFETVEQHGMLLPYPGE